MLRRSHPNNFCLLYIAVVLNGCLIIFLNLLVQSNNNEENTSEIVELKPSDCLNSEESNKQRKLQ